MSASKQSNKKSKIRKKEKKVIYKFVKTLDPAVFEEYNCRNEAIKQILLRKARELQKYRVWEMIDRVYKMKEMLMSSIDVKGTIYVCKFCGKKFEVRTQAYTHILDVHDIPAI